MQLLQQKQKEKTSSFKKLNFIFIAFIIALASKFRECIHPEGLSCFAFSKMTFDSSIAMNLS